VIIGLQGHPIEFSDDAVGNGYLAQGPLKVPDSLWEYQLKGRLGTLPEWVEHWQASQPEYPAGPQAWLPVPAAPIADLAHDAAAMPMKRGLKQHPDVVIGADVTTSFSNELRALLINLRIALHERKKRILQMSLRRGGGSDVIVLTCSTAFDADDQDRLRSMINNDHWRLEFEGTQATLFLSSAG
jgi:hypothetical protein